MCTLSAHRPKSAHFGLPHLHNRHEFAPKGWQVFPMDAGMLPADSGAIIGKDYILSQILQCLGLPLATIQMTGPVPSS